MRLTVHETYAFTATGWYGWYGWCLILSMQRAPKNVLCMNMFVYACMRVYYIHSYIVDSQRAIHF